MKKRTTWVGKRPALHPTKFLFMAGCVVLVAAVRLGLTLFSYRTMRWLVPDPKATAKMPTPDDLEYVRQVRWGVRNAARLVPYASCLTQALAAEFLLARYGQQAELHIGVARDDDGRLHAHAWVTSHGRVVIGGAPAELERYARMTRVGLSGS